MYPLASFPDAKRYKNKIDKTTDNFQCSIPAIIYNAGSVGNNNAKQWRKHPSH